MEKKTKHKTPYKLDLLRIQQRYADGSSARQILVRFPNCHEWVGEPDYAPPRPVKITKTCGAQWGKVDFNPLKFGRQFQGKIKFCPINNCLTLTNTFLPRHAPRIFPLPRSAPRPKSSAPCIPEWHIATSCKSFRGWICHHPLSHTSKEFHHP